MINKNIFAYLLTCFLAYILTYLICVSAGQGTHEEVKDYFQELMLSFHHRSPALNSGHPAHTAKVFIC